MTLQKVVSIPFKRESVFKVDLDLAVEEYIQFQFPSNGKVYSKYSNDG